MMAAIRMAKTDDGRAAQIFVYDSIGNDALFFDTFSAKDMGVALEKAGSHTDLLVRINSYGGDAYQAIAMYSLLKDHAGTVNVTVDGIAASAASVVAMAGETVRMKTGSQLMIHDPVTAASGTADDLEKVVRQLRTTTEGVIDIYSAKSGKSPQAIAQMMRDETWMGAATARAEGFADKIDESTAVEMQATPVQMATARSRFRHMPAAALSLAGTHIRKENPVVPVTNPMRHVGVPNMTAKQRTFFIQELCQAGRLEQGVTMAIVESDLNQQQIVDTVKSLREGDPSPMAEVYRQEYHKARQDGVRMQATESEYIHSRAETDGIRLGRLPNEEADERLRQLHEQNPVAYPDVYRRPEFI